MKLLKFVIDLPIRFIFALVGFTVGGWIGWLGIILVLLRFLGVVHWPWWLAALPLEYGVIYCLYMTVDGALYRARAEEGRWLYAFHVIREPRSGGGFQAFADGERRIHRREGS